MTFEEYQKGTSDTWNKFPVWEDQVNNAIFGMVGELGEFVEMWKKEGFHDIPMDHAKAIKELGDILYYLTRTAELLGEDLDYVAHSNHAKLAARYPNGFVAGGGIR